MPAALHLCDFGEHVFAAFGEVAYQVGSSLHAKVWRDVDVRVLIPDEKYTAMELGEANAPWSNHRWVALVLAFNALGREMTGLPIDFQIQQQSWANEKFTGERNALLAGWRMCRARHVGSCQQEDEALSTPTQEEGT